MSDLWIQLFKLARLNLMRNFWKNFPIMMGVSLGVVGLLLISSYVRRINHAVEITTVFSEAKGHLAILKQDAHEKYFTNPRKFSISKQDTLKILELLSQQQEVDFASRVIFSQGFVNSETGNTIFQGLGVEKQYFHQVFNSSSITTVIPDWVMHESDFMKGIEMNGNQISITSIMLKNLNSNRNNHVQLIAQSHDGSFSAVDTTLHSIHSSGKELKEPVNLLSTYEHLSDLHQTESSSYVAIFLRNSADTQSLQSLLSQHLETLNLQLKVYRFTDSTWNPYYTGTRDFLYFVGSFFSLLVLTGCVLSIISFNFLNFQERKQEIGTLRSLGYSHKLTQFYFQIECFLLLFFSIGLGLLFTYIVIYLINQAGFQFTPPGLSKEVRFLLEPDLPTALLLCTACLFICLSISWYQTSKLIHEKISHLLQNSGV